MPLQQQQQQPQISDDEFRVLRQATQEATDGYGLMQRTGLDREQLTVALTNLIRLGVISVKGELVSSRIGESYIFVPPQVRGRALHVLGYPPAL